jgi:hypothetical protein
MANIRCVDGHLEALRHLTAAETFPVHQPQDLAIALGKSLQCGENIASIKLASSSVITPIPGFI